MDDLIRREDFLAEERVRYCMDCDRRKGMKNGKMKTLYDIGDAPCRSCDIEVVLDDLEEFEAVDAVEVKHGRWKQEQVNPAAIRFRCSECGEVSVFGVENYCWNCGARMDGEDDT